MKKWVFLFLFVGFWSCVTDELGDVSKPDEIPEFTLNVPSNFSWSAILQDVLLVNVLQNGDETLALDGTVMELYSENNELLDVRAIFHGTACFNLRIPTTTQGLKLRTPANNKVLEFSSLKRSINFEVTASCNFETDDTDGDGLYDQFDAEPDNPDIAIQINSDIKPQLSSYFIFEDLWPVKGDFDFNDFIVKTNFAWTRGKENYIKEITGICEAQWDDSQFGLGFELFETRGAYLIYLDDIIQEIEGASETELIENGFVVLTETEYAGKATRKFTIKLKNNSLTDFVCLPYLFRIGKEEHQIRPFGIPPTRAQQMDMFHSGDDDSPRNWHWIKGAKFKYPLVGHDAFYRTEEGFPWGVQFISNDFVPSAEMQSILTSYPKFEEWAESGGNAEKDWYSHPAQY